MKLDPHLQFIPDEHNVQLFLSQYGITLHSFVSAATGIENCTLIVRSGKGTFVLRVYRQANKTLRGIKQELAFINYLHEHGIPAVPCLANSSGSMISELRISGQLWRGVLMPFINGDEPTMYGPELIRDMAKSQAAMHALAANYSDPYPERLPRTGLRPFITLTGPQTQTLGDSRLLELVDRAQRYALEFDAELPRGLCHTDFCDGNLLVSKQQRLQAILDFDDLRDVPYTVCLAYTLWDLHMQDARLVTRYVELYEMVRPLTGKEQASLKPFMLFRHYMVTLIKASSRDFGKEELARYLEVEQQLLG